MRSSFDILAGQWSVLPALSLLLLALAASAALPVEAAEQKHPDVIGVNAKARGPNLFDFDVTVSSPYDSAQRYADAFRAMGKDGEVFGERKLLHDHAGEQPFTRDLYGVVVPDGVRKVVIQAKDRKYGYGGKSVEVDLPGR